MSGKDLFFALMLLSSLALAGGCWWLDRRLIQAKQKQDDLNRQLQDALRRLEQAETRLASRLRADDFTADLAEADLKQRLKGGDGPKNVPEKYRMIAVMARRGLAAADIAAILEISLGEAEQLLKLVRVPGTTQDS